MYFGFSDPVSALFFVVICFYYLLIVVITLFPLDKRVVPHHYQIGLAVLLSAVITLVFWKKFGHNDLVVGTFWGSIIIGAVSFVIDIGDFRKHVREWKKFFKKL